MRTLSTVQPNKLSRTSNTGSVRLDWLQIGVFESDLLYRQHQLILHNELDKLIHPIDKITYTYSSGQTFWYKDCVHIFGGKSELIQVYRYPNTDKQPFLMFCFNGTFFNLLSIKDTVNLDKKYICTESYINKLISFNKIKKARISRIDLALDILKSDIKPYHVSRYHHENYFSRRGGNPPLKVIGPSFDENIKSPEGSTVYVGSAKGDWRITVYEKGKQLKLNNTFPDWVRVEVKLKGKRFELPFDIIDNPTGYFIKKLGKKFADEFIKRKYLTEANPESIKPLPSAKEKDNEQELIRHCKKMFGGLIYHLRVKGLKDDEIISKIIRPVIPKTLKLKEQILWQ